MAAEHHHEESLMEKIADKIHGHDSSSSSSDSDDDKSSSVKNKIYRLFGRETPLHKLLGSGKPADIVLWRNKKTSGAVLAGATAVYAVFELLEYHLLTLVCHCLILALSLSFLWANGSHFINKSPPRIPEVHIPEDSFMEAAFELRKHVNCGFAALHNIALGKDLKKFLSVVAGLWVLSIVGSCFSFVTLFYLSFVLLLTVTVIYEKYEDKVDDFAEKAMREIKIKYYVFDAKVLSKLPGGLQKFRKLA